MNTVYSRNVWKARPPKRRYLIDADEMPTDELWLHHTAGAIDANGNGKWADDMRAIQNFHMDGRGWSDIAYSFCGDRAGQVWEGRGAGIKGGHTKGRNSVSHGICAIGNYEKYKPDELLLGGLAFLVAHGLLEEWWATPITGPHREAPGAATKCCGKYLIGAIPEINQEAELIVKSVRDTLPIAPVDPVNPNHTRADVEALYRKFAGREGDQGGIRFWMQSPLSEMEIAFEMMKAEGMDRLWAAARS